MIYVLWNSFDSLSGILSLLIILVIIYAQPNLATRIENETSIQYYCIIVIVTLLFAVELCKTDKSLILTTLLAAGIMAISLYVSNKVVIYLSVFLNIYVLIRMARILIESDRITHLWNGIIVI